MGRPSSVSSNDGDEASTLIETDLNSKRDVQTRQAEEPASIVNCLHHLSGISALVLVLYVIAANRRYAGRVEGHKSRSSSSTAFVYLASAAEKDVANLAHSLESLSSNFNQIAGYRVIIVHDGGMNQTTQTELQTNFPSHLEFRNTTLSIPDELFKTYNLSSTDSPFMKRGTWNYQNMNRWWFKVLVSDQSPLNDIDIIARLDTDTAFTAPVERDFLEDFSLGKKVYGYSRVSKQCTLVDGLKEFVTQYVAMNSIRPKNPTFWAQIVRNKQSPCVTSFANYFEVMDLRYWRSHQGIRAWQDVVEKNGGIFRNGWGDGTLRFLTVSMFTREERVLQLPRSMLGQYEHPHRLATKRPDPIVG